MVATYAVIGLGSVGSFALRALARAGHTVLGFEAGGVASDRTAVGGDTRLFRRLYREGPDYHDLLERSLELWEAENRQTPDTFVKCGGLYAVGRGSDADLALGAYGAQFGIDYLRLEDRELRERYPQFRFGPDEVGYVDPSGGFVRTDVAVHNAVHEAATAGAEIVDAFVSEVKVGGSGVEVITDTGAWRAERAIVAAGARSIPLLPALASRAEPRRILMTWFQAEDPARFTPGAFPVFTQDDTLYGGPTLDGRHVKVAGMVPSRAMSFDGYDYAESPSRAELASSATAVGELFTGLHSTPVRSGVYPDLFTTDGRFVLDWADPDWRVFAATGFSGAGFKMSCALGEHAAGVVTGDAATMPGFSLSRFQRA